MDEPIDEPTKDAIKFGVTEEPPEELPPGIAGLVGAGGLGPLAPTPPTEITH